jgi:hypothetical protein
LPREAAHPEVGIRLGDARTEFAGARTDVQNTGIARQPIEIDQRFFLRPNGFDLCREATNHRFVRHLLALGIELGVAVHHGRFTHAIRAAATHKI